MKKTYLAASVALVSALSILAGCGSSSSSATSASSTGSATAEAASTTAQTADTAAATTDTATADTAAADTAETTAAAEDTSSEEAETTYEFADQTIDAEIPEASGDDTTIHVGAVPTPHGEVLEQLTSDLADKGWTLDIVTYNDYVQPNQALDTGDLDANYFQHKPYLDDYNEKNGTDLVGVAAIHFEPLGIYSKKYTDVASIPDGATIAIPNDTTNEARALLLLQANDLITLKDGVGLEATPLDIADNPHNITFTELEAAQTARVIDDVDYAVVNGNYAIDADIKDDQVAVESAESEAAQTYANLLVVRAGDEETAKTTALKNAILSSKVRDFINDNYNGAVVPVF